MDTRSHHRPTNRSRQAYRSIDDQRSLIFNVALSVFQESRAEAALELLNQRLSLKARVKRDGRWVELPAAVLVPGDVVQLSLGVLVPGDVRIIEGSVLLDQSMLTGESMPVDAGPGKTAYAARDSLSRPLVQKSSVTSAPPGCDHCDIPGVPGFAAAGGSDVKSTVRSSGITRADGARLIMFTFRLDQGLTRQNSFPARQDQCMADIHACMPRQFFTNNSSVSNSMETVVSIRSDGN
jgi:hypothetical protein